MTWLSLCRRRRNHLLRAIVLAAACAGPGVAASQGYTLPPVATPGGDTVVVERVAFDGHRAFTTAELDALAAPFLRRPVRRIELEELRQRITRAYVERGYVNSGALLDDDAVRDGTLRLRIVEGTVGTLRLQGMGGLVDDYVAARLVAPGDRLDVKLLQQRFRLLLADPLFERIHARLLPGDALGSSVLALDVVRARPWQLSLFAHNHLAPAVGSRAAGVEGLVRNLTGWGDTLAGSLAEGGGSTSGEVSFTLPLAAGTTTLQARLTQGASSVVEEPLAQLGIESRVRSRELTLAHPFVDRADLRFTLGLAATHRRNRTTLDGEPFSFVAGEPTGTTELHALRLFQDLVLRLDRQVLALRSTFVAGRNNLAAEALVPGQPARRYRLWVGQAQAALPFGEAGAQVQLRATVQRSSDHLVPLEQLGIGGRHTVRGYRENTLVRDQGYTFSAEYHHPLAGADGGAEGARRRLALVPFVDIGRAGNRGAAASPLASAGLGLVWQYEQIEGEFFYARRLERRPVDTHGDLQDRGIHLLLRWRPF